MEEQVKIGKFTLTKNSLKRIYILDNSKKTVKVSFEQVDKWVETICRARPKPKNLYSFLEFIICQTIKSRTKSIII